MNRILSLFLCLFVAIGSIKAQTSKKFIVFLIASSEGATSIELTNNYFETLDNKYSEFEFDIEIVQRNDLEKIKFETYIKREINKDDYDGSITYFIGHGFKNEDNLFNPYLSFTNQFPVPLEDRDKALLSLDRINWLLMDKGINYNHFFLDAPNVENADNKQIISAEEEITLTPTYNIKSKKFLDFLIPPNSKNQLGIYTLYEEEKIIITKTGGLVGISLIQAIEDYFGSTFPSKAHSFNLALIDAYANNLKKLTLSELTSNLLLCYFGELKTPKKIPAPPRYLRRRGLGMIIDNISHKLKNNENDKVKQKWRKFKRCWRANETNALMCNCKKELKELYYDKDGEYTFTLYFKASLSALMAMEAEICADKDSLYSYYRRAYCDLEDKDNLGKYDRWMIKKMKKYAYRTRNNYNKKTSQQIFITRDTVGGFGVFQYVYHKRDSMLRSYELQKSRIDTQLIIIDYYIDTINAEIDSSNQKIQDARENIRVLRDSTQRVQKIVDEDTDFFNDRVRYGLTTDIPNSKDIQPSDIDAVHRALKCIQSKRGKSQAEKDDCFNGLNSLQLLMITQSQSLLGDVNDTLGGLILVSDTLGTPCPENRKIYTEKLIPTLLSYIEAVPDKYLSEIEIDATFEGRADYVGRGKLLRKHKEVPENINQKYENTRGQTTRFNKDAGKQQITNEELAFLRAYCTYTILRDELKKIKGGQVKIHKKKFIAIEQKISQGKHRADNFRGAKVSIYVKNLYTYLKERIDGGEGKIIEWEYDIEEYWKMIDREKAIRNAKIKERDRYEREREDLENKKSDIQKKIIGFNNQKDCL